jgi:chemotaxis protein CheX
LDAKGKFVIDEEILVRSVIESTSEVFSTMLEMEVKFAGMAEDAETSVSGLISLVGITGDWGGSGVFCCTPRFAAIVCRRMLGSEVDPENPVINEEVLDVVAELTNMMVGNMKNGLESITGPLAISVPTVIHGRNFQFRNAAGLKGASLRFEGEDEQFEVRIALAPVAVRSTGHSKIPVLGLAHA